MCAVMQMNLGENWKLDLGKECGIELSDETRVRLAARYAKDIAQNNQRRTPERQATEAIRRRSVKTKASMSGRGAADYRLPLVSYDDAVEIESYLKDHPDDPNKPPDVPGDPEYEIVERTLDDLAIPDERRAELPVPLLADYVPPTPPFIVPLPRPSIHWVPVPTDELGVPIVDDGRAGPEEEEETDPLPMQLADTGLPFMDADIPVYLEDDPSGAQFRVVMEEGGKQCPLVYRRGQLDPESFD
jgi:hypothetical protein